MFDACVTYETEKTFFTSASGDICMGDSVIELKMSCNYISIPVLTLSGPLVAGNWLFLFSQSGMVREKFNLGKMRCFRSNEIVTSFEYNRHKSSWSNLLVKLTRPNKQSVETLANQRLPQWSWLNTHVQNRGLTRWYYASNKLGNHFIKERRQL